LTPEEQSFIDDWVIQVFGDVDGDIEWVRGDWSVVVRGNGRIVGQLEIIERMVEVDGQPVSVGGIANVMTLDGWKRRGLASAAMHQAVDFIREELRADFGLLVCEEKLILFYERLGWHVVEGPLIAEQSRGRIVLPHVAMVYACQKSEWPQGKIDLCGLPW